MYLPSIHFFFKCQTTMDAVCYRLILTISFSLMLLGVFFWPAYILNTTGMIGNDSWSDRAQLYFKHLLSKYIFKKLFQVDAISICGNTQLSGGISVLSWGLSVSLALFWKQMQEREIILSICMPKMWECLILVLKSRIMYICLFTRIR